MNRQLFSMLKIQQLVLFIVIGLIVFVSTFNIVSTLIMTVHEKRKEIGILASMGAEPRMVRRVFIWYGTIVGLAGTATGVVLGTLVCWVITRYELVSFPPEIAEVYFVSSIPFVTRGDRSRGHRRLLDRGLVSGHDHPEHARRAAQSGRSTAVRMKAETVQLGREFQDVIRGGNELAAQLDDATLMRRPAAASWSVAENLEHLSATAATFGTPHPPPARWRGGADRRHRRETNHPRTHLAPPRGAARAHAPESSRGGAAAGRDRLPRGVAGALRGDAPDAHRPARRERRYDRMRLRIPTPFAKRITVTLLDSFAVLAAHGAAHLWQARARAALITSCRWRRLRRRSRRRR